MQLSTRPLAAGRRPGVAGHPADGGADGRPGPVLPPDPGAVSGYRSCRARWSSPARFGTNPAEGRRGGPSRSNEARLVAQRAWPRCSTTLEWVSKNPKAEDEQLMGICFLERAEQDQELRGRKGRGSRRGQADQGEDHRRLPRAQGLNPSGASHSYLGLDQPLKTWRRGLESV